MTMSERMSRRKRYACAHGAGSVILSREHACEREAVLLSPGCPGMPRAHNCCGAHVSESETGTGARRR